MIRCHFAFACLRWPSRACSALRNRVTAMLGWSSLIPLAQPQTACTIAVNRTADVAIGTAAALLVTFLLPALPDAPGSPPVSSPIALPLLFWRRRHAGPVERWLRENA